MCTFVHKVKSDILPPKTPTKTPAKNPTKNLSEQSELCAKNLPKTRQKTDKPQLIEQ
jgi:hypothetical protein